MPKKLNSIIGTSMPTLLLAKPDNADPIAVPLYPTPGTYKPGTLLYRMDSGFYAPAAAAQAVSTNMLVVLGEEITVDEGETVAPAVQAFRAGCFVDGAVKLASDAPLTAAIKVILRAEGIVFSPETNTAEDFNNGGCVVTYVANNGADPAEEDYDAPVLPGASHTVLANTVTGFTAPSGKSFSKWNTEADGSGTDYAAGASYTAGEDLTLYAVWA